MKTHHRILALGLVGLACLGGVGCSSATATPPDAGTTVQPLTSDFELRNDMRKLWEDHVTWTRVYLIDAIAGLPDTSQAATRLLQNQVDIGNAIKPFYGNAAGDQLTGLLHDHITGAVAVVDAAKAGDAGKLATAKTAWYANGDQIATFLAGANPSWSAPNLKIMMQMHLDQTLAEATARLTGDWAGDIIAYDTIVSHILDMADALSSGIAKQFPDKVSVNVMPQGDQDLHRSMRKLWEDHVTWTRVFLIDAIAGLPDTPQATARLLQNQVDIGNAIKPFYGDAAGDQLASLLHDHITGAADVVTAAKAGDAGKVATAKAAWYANADQIAVFLAGANPNWPATELKSHMHAHLDQTLAEATARLTSDWAADVVDYDAVVVHILEMSDVLSDGIYKQFPTKVQ
ncbi:hypothetical protein BH09MYX1_BH09MYX1_01570 [soil metagenome]